MRFFHRLAPAICCAVFPAIYTSSSLAQSGACCSPTVCFITDDGPGCEANGRTFFEGEDCAPNPCAPSQTGACCVEGLGCQIDTSAGCAAFGGIFLGVSSICDDDACVAGACCQLDGTCTFVFEPTCNQQGGLFAAGVACVNAGCGEGACCTASLCTIRTRLACVFNGGDFLGAGTGCAGEPCGPPLFGGCCVEGFCFVDSQSACAAQEGAWLGANSTCDGNPCDVGSCCQAGFACFQAVENDCTAQGGEFIAGGQDCESDCGFGACCFEAGCSVVPAFDCLMTGNLFVPDATCESNPCAPCLTCPADVSGDGRLDGVDVQGFVDCIIAANGGAPTPACRCADTNQDALLTTGDVDAFMAAILTSEGGLCP